MNYGKLKSAIGITSNCIDLNIKRCKGCSFYSAGLVDDHRCWIVYYSIRLLEIKLATNSQKEFIISQVKERPDNKIYLSLAIKNSCPQYEHLLVLL